ncbi:O-antigen ligase family protein [Gloeocapsopsis dulcis]|uniref:Capsular biosynthesis protein n=2 Tax=Gloeocapsopsis TaxID=693222 RepID=A0A6N8FSJ6_9CHRO|nr:O-antigen ligase family protein [Gloeocapsopsis dulcis]MUL35819.1 capsular biosynthesis protein [Gloeocapsopsis dulcis AAB1 = 1H9]WNN87714.1 O-antigen ligase family protein [Gloeocapsopsis dulcis]
MKPCNFEEKVIWYSILGTYGFYFTGLLYYIPPAIAWILTIYLIRKLWLQKDNSSINNRITIPWEVWVWIVSMAAIEFATIFGHADFNLGTASLIKATIGWAKGWALFALFPLIGCLNIRPKLLCRAVCLLCLQSLIILSFCYVASLLRLNISYTAPLNFFGGPKLAFSITLYTVQDSWLRIALFAPWATIIGFVGNVFLPLSLLETKQRLRWIGIITSLLMCWFSGSRANMLALPTAWIATQILANSQRPFLWLTAGFSSLITGLFAPNLINAMRSFQNWMRSLRKNSNSEREALDRIAIRRWAEAPITGHGVTDSGPSRIVGVNIGTHNNWTGLLFINGIIGVLALGVSLTCSFISLVIRAQESQIAKSALHILLIIFCNTFVDSLNMTAYLVAPGLVFLGTAFREPLGKQERRLFVPSST